MHYTLWIAHLPHQLSKYKALLLFTTVQYQGKVRKILKAPHLITICNYASNTEERSLRSQELASQNFSLLNTPVPGFHTGSTCCYSVPITSSQQYTSSLVLCILEHRCVRSHIGYFSAISIHQPCLTYRCCQSSAKRSVRLSSILTFLACISIQ